MGKKGSKGNRNQTAQPKDIDAILKRRLLDKERKEKRSEMFNTPSPMLKSGRKTRLQISLVQKERNRKRKETLDKKKRKIAAPGDQPKKKADSSDRSQTLSASKTSKHIVPGARRSARAHKS